MAHDTPPEIDLYYPPTVVGGYEVADRFVSDEEAAALIESFDWEDTLPVEEVDERGAPRVYYTLIHIDSQEGYELLERARVPFDIQPLFASERRELPEAALSMSGSGAYGGWVFALLGGTLYNIARDAALSGQPLYSIIALRELPPDAPTLEDGSIDLAALAAAGFRWPEPSADAPDGAAVAALSETISDVGRFFAEAGDAVARAWQDFWGWIIGEVSPDTVVSLDLTISTPDADFQPAGEAMLRTWSPGRGTEISNVGQEIWAEQLGFPFSRWSTTLGPGNTATITVPNGLRVRFCTLNRIPGRTSVHDAWIPTRTCTGPVPLPAAPAANVNVTLAEQNLQALTIAEDGVAFMAAQQIFVRPPSIAANNHAEAITPTENGYVIGLGGRDPASLIASTLLDFATLGLLGPIRFGMNVDIVWPPGNPSRVVFAHEVGHHLFYQMMNNISNEARVDLYGIHLVAIYLGTIANPGIGETGFGALTANEGIADLIGYQLSGGWNRMPSGVRGGYPGDSIGTALPTMPGLPPQVGEGYCDPTTPGPNPICFDVNLDGATGPGTLFAGANNESLRDAVSLRLATIIHDVIDDFFGGVNHNGPVWVPVGGTCMGAMGGLPCPSATMLVPAPGPSAGVGEEPLALPFNIVLFALQGWLRTAPDQVVLDIDMVVRGLTRALRAVGVPDAVICQVYGLHTPGGGCPPEWLP